MLQSGASDIMITRLFILLCTCPEFIIQDTYIAIIQDTLFTTNIKYTQELKSAIFGGNLCPLYMYVKYNYLFRYWVASGSFILFCIFYFNFELIHYIHTYIHGWTTNICMCVLVCVCVCHTHTHTHTHTCTHYTIL